MIHIVIHTSIFPNKVVQSLIITIGIEKTISSYCSLDLFNKRTFIEHVIDVRLNGYNKMDNHH